MRMKQREKRWIPLAGALGLAAAIAILLWLWQPWNTQDKALTAEEAEQVVLGQYEGDIEQIFLENGQYQVMLRSENGLYQLDLDAASGAIHSIRQTEKTGDTQQKALLSRDRVKAALQARTEGQVDRLELISRDGEPVYQAVIKEENGESVEIIVDPYTGETLLTQNIEPPQVNEEDKSARLLNEEEASKIALTEIPGVVDDVDLRDTDSGIPYYLIDIELEDGREATVEINAISGAIRSVTWDDDESDKDS